MIDYLKDRIALIVLILAGDFISLIVLIKADEIRNDAKIIAAIFSLVLSIVISLAVQRLLIKLISKRYFWTIMVSVCLLLWVVTIFSFLHFTRVNAAFGKIPYPKNHSLTNPIDSMIVGGCQYTPEAQQEVDDFKERKQTLTYAKLFDDFTYNVDQVWDDANRECAREQIIMAFGIMIVLFIASITLTCELILLPK